MNEGITALVTGSGRCGTLSLARLLDGDRTVSGHPVVASHETDFRGVSRALASGDRQWLRRFIEGVEGRVEVNPLLMLFPKDLLSKWPLIALVRDGRDTVRSGYNEGWYSNPNRRPWHWTDALPRFSGGRFEQCCQYWAAAYRKIGDLSAPVFRLEDISRGRGLNALRSRLGVMESARGLPHLHRVAPGGSKIIAAGGLPLPRYRDWSREQKAVFALHCTDVMDLYYPNWNAWGRRTFL